MHWMMHVPQVQMPYQENDKISWNGGFCKWREEPKEMIEVVQHIVWLVLLDVFSVAVDEHFHHFSLTQIIEGNSDFIFLTTKIDKQVEKWWLVFDSRYIKEDAFNDYFPDSLGVMAGSDGYHYDSVEFGYPGVIGYGNI